MVSASSNSKPVSSISLDLDNKWSFMKTHGDSGWEKFPSYLDIVIPTILDVLEELNLKITFFIVGQDAAIKSNQEFLKQITERGHETGNHSFHHDVWLNLYPKSQIKRDILDAEEAIFKVVGQRPVGFRGPGFVWNSAILEVLAENNYLYDASTLPTFVGPLARGYLYLKSDFTKEEKEKRKRLFGSFKDGLRPIKPYYWKIGHTFNLLEIPVTTIPFIKIPFHLSYLLYLSRFSKFLMLFYLEMAIFLCRVTGTNPSFLLHPLDLVSAEKIPELSFFPGMDLSGYKKRKIFTRVLKAISRHFKLVDMSTHARLVLNNS